MMDTATRMRLGWIQLYEETKDAGYGSRRCGISRPTLRKWLKRYKEDGLAGLKSQSKKPKHSPNRKIFEKHEEWILKLREEMNIGARRITTIHAYTASQAIVDSPRKAFERGRAGAANFVPTSTGAARATTKTLPELRNLFDGIAVRGPVIVGSLADIVIVAERKTSVEEIHQIFIEEAASERYRDIVGVTHDPIVSSDIINDPRASVIDLGMTRVVDGDLIKILSWYDNEWGFTNQMVREAQQLGQAQKVVS